MVKIVPTTSPVSAVLTSKRRWEYGTGKLSTVGSLMKIAVTEAFLLLMFQNPLATNGNGSALMNLCNEQNGTVCNHRTPEGCSFGDNDPPALMKQSAVDPEVLFRLQILQRDLLPGKPTRYLKIEWVPGSDPGLVFVRVSPIVQGQLLQNEVTCMSNSGSNNKVVSRHVTVVPLFENATSALVEVFTNRTWSSYLVKTPKYSRHSWILQAVAITVQGNNAYISLSPMEGGYHLEYMLTLVCYSNVKGAHYTEPITSPLNITSQSLSITNCSSLQQEIYPIYDRSNPRPIVFEMDLLVYELWVDARLLDVYNKEPVETFLKTLKFGPSKFSAAEDHKSISKSTDIEATMMNRTPVNTYSLANTSGNQVVLMKEKASSFQDEIHSTPGVISLVWEIPAAIVGIIIVASGLLIFVRTRAGKINQNSAQKLDASKVKHSCETCNNKSKKSWKSFAVGRFCNGKSSFHLECCTNKVSRPSSSGDISDPMLSNNPASQEALLQIYNVRKTHASHTEDQDSNLEYFKEHGFAQQYHDDMREYLHYNEPHFDKEIQQTQLPLMETTYEDDLQMDIKKPTKYEDYIHQYSGKFSHSRKQYQDIISKGPSDSECGLPNKNKFLITNLEKNFDLDDFSVAEPEIYEGPLDPLTMRSECLKINKACEVLTTEGTDQIIWKKPQLQLEDECFSICESIAC